jgi:hypothetical protein
VRFVHILKASLSFRLHRFLTKIESYIYFSSQHHTATTTTTMDNAPMDALGQIIELLTIWKNNFINNLFGMWSMDAIRWIRLIVIVGVYLVFRSWIVKHAEKKQAREMAAARLSDSKAKLNANALRGTTVKKAVSFEESADESGDVAGKASGVQLDKKARKRQKQAEKRAAQTGEGGKMGAEETSEDPDLMDLLKDYESGEDGW